MPQTLVQKNGRYEWVGDDHSQDHTPPAPTTGPKPKAKPKAKAAQKPWWHPILNELRWTAKQVGGFNAGTKLISGAPGNPLMGGDPVYYDTKKSPKNLRAYSVYSPATRQIAAAVGPGAVQTAGEGVISLGQKILAPGKYADPRRSPPGRALNALTRTAYSVLGAKQPEDLTEGQRGVIDNLGRQAGIEIGSLPVGGALAARLAIKGAGWAARGLRYGTALGVSHGMGAFLQDSTQGNISNMVEALTGVQGVPLAVDPTKDDRVTAGFKSLIPNIVGGELLGLAGSAGARAVGKGFGSIRRYQRAAGANTAHVTAGEKLKARGLVEDIDGQQRFTEQALEKPAPVPIPQTPDQYRDAVLARWGRGAQQQPVTTPVDPQPVAATGKDPLQVPAEPPAPAPAATEQSSAAPAAAAAEIDPLPDPWSYDPALPEVADAQKLVSQLDPAELQAVAAVGADGGPVLQQIEEVIASRPAPQPREEISEAWAGIPTDRLSDIYLNGAGDLQPWSAQLDRLPATTLEELSHPDASPTLSQRISDDTGKEWPFSREEVINGMQALSADGTTIVPNRLRGDIRTMRTEDIYAAPKEFQYKEGVNAQGEQLGQSLGGVERWDPNAEGVLEVFSDPRDAKTKVVNGHNRLALAKRLGIPSLRVEEVNATTPASARAAGALSNISAGNGTPFDAAKFIRSTGLTDQAQLQAAGIPLDKGWGRQGLALSKLPQDIFQDAVNGEHRLGRYVALGESGLDEPGMRGAYQVLKQRPKMTEDTFREVLDQAKQQGNVVASSAQGGLFGDEVLNPMLQRAELVADVRSGLAKDRRLFGFATRNADALSEAGATTIDTAAAGQRVADAQQALGLFDTLKNQSGPVGELLSNGAERIAQGENASIVAKQVQREIGDSIERELANSGMKATPQDLAVIPPEPPDAEATSPVRRRRGTPISDGLGADLNALGGALANHMRGLDGYLQGQASKIDARQQALAAEAADAMAELPGLDRATLEAHAIQRAIANGEVRPTEMQPLDLPPAPSADIRAVQRELAAMDPTLPLEDQLPNMPATRQAAADELRLAAEYARQDAEIAWAAETAAREAEGYDLLSLQEKKAQGLGAEWFTPETDSRGQGRNFHGAADRINLVSGGEFGGDGMNIYGDGFYTTDDVATAAKYRKKNRRSAGSEAQPTVYEAIEKQPVRFFDLEKDDSPAVNALLNDIVAQGRYGADLVEQAIEDASTGTLGEIMDEMRAWSRSMEIPAYEVQGIFQEIIDTLQSEGYGGFTHTGGAKAGGGKRLHTVSIYWNPADAIGLKEMRPVVTPEVMDTTVMEAGGRARPTDELIRREKRNEALTQKADALARAKRSVLDIQHGLDNLEQTRPGPDAQKRNVTAWNRNVKKYTRDLKLAKEAVVDAQKAMDAQQALADAEWELALNDANPEVMDTTVMPKESKTPIADLFEQQMRQMAESDARLYRRTGEAVSNIRQNLDVLAEVSGAPGFTLPPELAKASPRYGRNKLQFESDLDRAAYVLANDKAKGGSVSADKFRNELIAAGFDPDQVAAHGKTVKEAVKAAARDTSAETVVVPVQDFAAGRPRLPLPEQQRQIDGTRAQIDDLQQKLNEGGCGT
jgi:hypothetical protein